MSVFFAKCASSVFRVTLLFVLISPCAGLAVLTNDCYFLWEVGRAIPGRELRPVWKHYTGTRRLRPSVVGGLGFGVYFTPRLRADVKLSHFVSFSYRHDRADIGWVNKQNFRSTTFTVNLHYDFFRASLLSLYVDGGTGIARNYSSALRGTQYRNKRGLAIMYTVVSFRKRITYIPMFSYGIGMTFDVARNVALDTGYRAINFG